MSYRNETQKNDVIGFRGLEKRRYELGELLYSISLKLRVDILTPQALTPLRKMKAKIHSGKW